MTRAAHVSAATQAKRRFGAEPWRSAALRALALKPDSVEALIYKALLLRLKATLTEDPRQPSAYQQHAEELIARAKALKKAARVE